MTNRGEQRWNLLRAAAGLATGAVLCATALASPRRGEARMSAPTPGHFERMMFNNPGLEVDLSLGIWPHVAVYDYDHDGKMDIVLRAASVPISGSRRQAMCRVYLSPTERHAGRDVPVSASRAPDGRRHPDASGVSCPHPRKPNGLRANFVDLDSDGVEDLVYSVSDWSHYGKVGPACPVSYDAAGVWTNGQIETFVYFVRNAGTLREPKWEAPMPIVSEGDAGDVLRGPWGGHAAMFHDFDGDGDMDFVTGEFVDGFWYFENMAGKGAPPRFAKGRRILTPDGSPLAVDLCMFDPVLEDFDGDGLKDLVAADEDGRVAVYRNTGAFKGGVPVFQPGRFLRQKAQELKFGCLATPFGCDWDGDGDWDFICGNSAGYIAFMENMSGPGVERPKWAEPRYLTVGGKKVRTMAGWSGSPQGPAERKWGYSSVSVGDWDGDGILDVMANDINGDVLLYRGIRRGGTEVEAAVGIEVEWDGEQPMPPWEWRGNPGRRLRAPWRSTVEMFDWNRDGLQDLVAMDCEGFLVLYERFRCADGALRLKSPRRVFVDEKDKPLCFNSGAGGGSGRARFRLVDWDGDGRTDILQAAFNARLVRQVADRDGRSMFRYGKKIGEEQLQGHTCCPTTVDFNGDGIPDLVIAAEDGYFYYLPNPATRPASEVHDNATYGEGPTAARTDSSGFLGPDSVVRVSAPSGRATAAAVTFDLPAADWRALARTGEGLKAKFAWHPVGAGMTVPWYVLLNDGKKTYGFGVKVQPRAMCAWRVAPGKVELLLDLRAGGRPLDLGARTLEACEVVRCESAPGESAYATGRRLCALMCPRPRLPKEPMFGFNDWYAAYGRNTATNFLADAAFVVSLCKGLPVRPYVVMDDGWQKFSPPEIERLTGKFDSGYGPWEESSRTFGMDMKTFCEEIAALGAKPGLWYRPLCMEGKMCDPSDPAVIDRIRADISRFRGWGFKFVKIDYLTYDWCGHFKGFDDAGRLIRDERAWKESKRTTAEIIADLYRAIRDAAGDDMVVLGCNAVNHLCAGLFESSRVGPDTSGRAWEQTKRNGVGAVAFKGIENGTLFAADPDCAGLASEGAIPWEKNRQWIDLLSRSGMPFFISWRRSLADADVRETLADAFRRASKPRQTAEAEDWFESSAPRRWNTADGPRSYVW